MNQKAARLLELGLTPVLLGSSGDALKRPQLKAWQTATVTAGDVATWPARHNIGVRCGQTLRPGRFLVVFDFDYDAARIFPQWRDKAETIVKAPLVVVTSGKGFHVYFYTQTEKTAQRLALSEDRQVLIETIGRRKQVVTPGSLHPSGKRYKFASEAKYADIPTVTNSQYKALAAAAVSFDRRPARPVVNRVASDPASLAGTGELAGVTNCLDYAEKFILPELSSTLGDGSPRTEITFSRRVDDAGKWVRREELYIHGYAGLKILTDGSGWYCHSEERGGGLPELIAWHRGIPVGQARDMLRPATNFVIYPGEHVTTIRLHSGQFLGDVALDLPQRAYLKANTGTGKTTYAINLEGNILLVVPTVAILQQLQYKHGAAVYYHEEKTVQGGERLIITTPDSLPHIFPLIDSSRYTLVVDEAHNIALAGYRKKAYDNVVRALNGAWARVVLMTGTPVPLVTANLEIFESVAVSTPARVQHARRVSFAKGGKLDAILDRIPQNGRSLVFLNDKRGQLHKLIFKLKERGFISDQIAVINSDTRESEDYKLLVETEEIPDITRVLICTSVISEGFNIRTEFDTVHIASYSSSIEAQQVVNRFRTAAPGIVYWYNNGEGEGSRLNLGKVARQILNDALVVSEALNTNPEIDLNSDDVFLKDLNRARLAAVSRLYTAQIIETEEDLETGDRYYQPSPVGVNHAMFQFLQQSENTHPELFKRNTAAYGWAWLPDDTAAAAGAGDTEAARDYAAEKLEEEALFNEYIVETMRTQGRDFLQDNIRNGIGDGDYFRLGKAVLLFDDILRDFDAACDAAILTGGKTRATNTLARRLRIQQAQALTYPHNAITGTVYQVFSEGERLTPEEIRERLTAVLDSDTVTREFIRPATAGGRAPLDERKAVSLLADYFDMKRCKVSGDDGSRANAYELLSCVPTINSVSLNSLLYRENSETVVLEIPGFVNDQAQTAVYA